MSTERMQSEASVGPDEQRLGDMFNPLLWLIGALWQYRMVVMAVVVLGVGIAILLADRLPNTYTAVGVMEIDRESDDVLAARGASTFVPPETITETEAEVIASSSVLQRVVDALDLEYSAANPLLRNASFEAPTGRAIARSAIVAEIQKNLVVRPTGRSFIVEVAHTARDPRFAADVVNAVMVAYLGVEVSAERAFAREAIGLLSERLSDLRRELDAREGAVQAFRSTGRVAEGAGTEILSRQLARLDEELIRARTALATAADAAGGDPRTSSDALGTSDLETLRRQEAGQAREVARLEAQHGPQHLELVEAREALTVLSDAVAREAKRTDERLETEERLQRGRVRALEAEVQRLRTRLNAQRVAEVELQRLEREVDAARKVYGTFLDRFNEVQGTTGLERADGRIIASAVPSHRPSGPNRMLVVAGGGLMSMALGAGLAVALALMDTRIRGASDLTRASGFGPIATLPAPPRRSRTSQLTRGLGRRRRRNVRFADAIMQLRTALVLGSSANGRAIVAFTAAAADADHAGLVVALGQACAVAGDDVVLVDADFSRPSVHERLGGRNEYGLAEIVTQDGDLESALQLDTQSPLAYLPAGSALDPALYRSRGLDDVLDRLARDFDVVLIVLPPLLAHAEAHLLAAGTNVTAIVVRSGVSERGAVEDLTALLRYSGYGQRLATILMRG